MEVERSTTHSEDMVWKMTRQPLIGLVKGA